MTKNEFEKLRPGQIIQHKKNNEWVFIVHQNFGERLTAVRTIEVNDPESWETVTEVKVKETEQNPTPPQEDPAFRLAAHNLHEALKGATWYSMVGMGNYKLIVYTAKKKYTKPYDTFEGYPVEYKYSGGMTLAHLSPWHGPG